MKKRKVGRPKKRGPKKKRRYISKKPKIDGRTLVCHRKYYNYKIIACHNNRQVKTIGRYEDIKQAYSKFEDLKKENEKVVFKMVTHASERIEYSKDEYLLLEINDSGQKENMMLRNSFGRFTEVSSTSKDWVIIDSIPRNVEETFYVYGYNPRTERKTFSWIYDNIITCDIGPYEIKRVLVYKNKVVIKNDDSTFDIIFCKNNSDAITFYNKLNEVIKANKQKHIYFIGSYSELSDKRKKLENDLMAYTGFSKKKLQIPGTDYYKK